MSTMAEAKTASAERNVRLTEEKLEAMRNWVENQEIPPRLDPDGETEDTDLEDLESIAESSVVESSDCGDYETDTETDSNTVSTHALGTQITPTDINRIMRDLQKLFNSASSIQPSNIHIENSSGVHIGNITNINGNIQIIQKRFRQKSNSKPKREDDKETASQSATKPQKLPVIEEREERIDRGAFMNRIKFKVPKGLCPIVPRSSWLAQQPMEDYEYLTEPAPLVIISHTATESSEKQAINVRIIRDIQCFHIESRGWEDIGYNFLVGCDGNVYEGRGWGTVGAHTLGYNTCSIGISFIGCFMRELPTEVALDACKNFLKRGVAEGHIAADYKLVAHCQCRPTESPGRKLYEELQKWENFSDFAEEK